MNTQIIVGGIVVVALLFAGWWFTTKPSGSSPMTSDTSGSATSGTSAAGVNPYTLASGEAVTAKDQAAGSSVAVASVTLNQMGWVAVRDENGRVLGAARFDAGTYENVPVPLLRATIASSTYQVLLYVDDGDRQFDLHKDILITTAGGGVAGTTFKTL